MCLYKCQAVTLNKLTVTGCANIWKIETVFLRPSPVIFYRMSSSLVSAEVVGHCYVNITSWRTNRMAAPHNCIRDSWGVHTYPLKKYQMAVIFSLVFSGLLPPLILIDLHCTLHPLLVFFLMKFLLCSFNVFNKFGSSETCTFLCFFQIICCPVHNQTGPLSMCILMIMVTYPSTPWAACLDGCPCLKPAAGPSHPEALGSTTGNR